jgi:dTMP kinase
VKSRASTRRRGLLITLEGGEGAGKSTQAALLVQRFHAEGMHAITSREPGGTTLGERVRELTRDPAAPMAELFLFEAARTQLVAEVLAPQLAIGTNVVLDRFTDSTLAYQGYGRGIDLDVIGSLNRIATGACVPDMTILLDLDVRAGLDRKLGEIGRDAIGKEHRAFHERVRAGYHSLAATEPGRWVTLDASLPPDSLADRIWDRVATLVHARTEGGSY